MNIHHLQVRKLRLRRLGGPESVHPGCVGLVFTVQGWRLELRGQDVGG